ncbi:MAG: hypothetical protein CMI54_07690 [Parcubacteria group bacterium]|nr:hypothetical protein [Parcubacteria group bacterium]|tara:strand:+ start:5698 stop:6666 length:969 start_codon:yes stop_codon:yes gene_type:complete
MVNILESLRQRLEQRRELKQARASQKEAELAQEEAFEEFEREEPQQAFQVQQERAEIATVQREEQLARREKELEVERATRRLERKSSEEEAAGMASITRAQAEQAREFAELKKQQRSVRREEAMSERRFGGLFPSQEQSELRAESQAKKLKLEESIAVSRANIQKARGQSGFGGIAAALTSPGRSRAGVGGGGVKKKVTFVKQKNGSFKRVVKTVPVSGRELGGVQPTGAVRDQPSISMFSGGSPNDVVMNQRPASTPRSVGATSFFVGGSKRNVVPDTPASFFVSNGKRGGNASVESILAPLGGKKGRGRKRGPGRLPSLF